MIRLITAISTLFSSAANDFFNKTFGKEPFQFKMWMIIIIAASVALLIILSALLIAVSVKGNKERKALEESLENETDDSQSTADDATDESNKNVNVEENTSAVEDTTPNNETVVEDTTTVNEIVVEDATPADTTPEEANTANDNACEVATAANETPASQNQSTVTIVETVTVVEKTTIIREETTVADNKVVTPTADVVDNGEAKENKEPVQENTVATTIINTNESDNKEASEETMKNQNKDESNGKVVLGKVNYYLEESGWYFTLDANNGQQLYLSYSYTTLDGAQKGFENFAKAVSEGNFIVSEDKNGRFRYILNKKYQGPNYKTKAQCENAIESVKKFSKNYKVNVIESTPELEAAFAKYLEELKKSQDIDMEEIAKEEANTPKSGAFEIEEVDGGFRYYLYANNRQILYTSNIYASAASARNAIDAFKKAVYGGVMIIEKDKFANYRFILRNSSNVTYAGESYESEASAKKSFESVKRFVKSATIVPYRKKVEGDDAE